MTTLTEEEEEWEPSPSSTPHSRTPPTPPLTARGPRPDSPERCSSPLSVYKYKRGGGNGADRGGQREYKSGSGSGSGSGAVSAPTFPDDPPHAHSNLIVSGAAVVPGAHVPPRSHQHRFLRPVSGAVYADPGRTATSASTGGCSPRAPVLVDACAPGPGPGFAPGSGGSSPRVHVRAWGSNPVAGPIAEGVEDGCGDDVALRSGAWLARGLLSHGSHGSGSGSGSGYTPDPASGGVRGKPTTDAAEEVPAATSPRTSSSRGGGRAAGQLGGGAIGQLGGREPAAAAVADAWSSVWLPPVLEEDAREGSGAVGRLGAAEQPPALATVPRAVSASMVAVEPRGSLLMQRYPRSPSDSSPATSLNGGPPAASANIRPWIPAGSASCRKEPGSGSRSGSMLGSERGSRAARGAPAPEMASPRVSLIRRTYVHWLVGPLWLHRLLPPVWLILRMSFLFEEMVGVSECTAHSAPHTPEP